MDILRCSFWFVTAVALILSGCSAIPQHDAVHAVRMCGAEGCDLSGQKYSAAQVLAGVQELLKANEGERITICKSDPSKRTCESVGICQFVLGGFLPGNGCASSIVFSDIERIEPTELRMKADMPLSFIGTPVYCATATSSLSVRSPSEIALVFQPRFCSWMVVGTMSATFNIAMDSVDPERGEVGGYWSHAVSGTGNGRGSGYALLQFPKPIPRGANWRAVQAVQPATTR